MDRSYNISRKPQALYVADNDKVTLVKEKAYVEDILDQVMAVDRQLDQQSLSIGQFDASYDGLRDLYNTVKQNVEYRNDPNGMEIVKAPGFAWKNRTCDIGNKVYCGSDCKSFAPLVSSQLRRMGIPYRYDAVQRAGEPSYRHVYPVAVLDGRDVIMDAVPGTQFDVEGPYIKKRSYAGTPIAEKVGLSNKSVPASNTSVAVKVIGGLILAWFVYSIVQSIRKNRALA